MKCPFLHGSQAPATQDAKPAISEQQIELSRRTLLSLGSLTAGGMFLATVPGCSSSSSEEEDDSAAVADGSESFLAAYDAIPNDPQVAAETDPAKKGAKIVQLRGALIGTWMRTKYNQLFAELRAKRPVLVPGGPLPTLIALHEDVIKVMQDWDSFQVVPYQREMVRLVDHFTLMDSPPGIKVVGVKNPDGTYRIPPASDAEIKQINDATHLRHDREKQAFLEAMAKIDMQAMRRRVREEADNLVNASIARSPGRIELVGELGKLLPVRVLGFYFGVHSTTTAPDSIKQAASEAGITLMSDEELYQHVANSFENFFLNITTATPALQKAGTESGRALLKYIDDLANLRAAKNIRLNDLMGEFMALESKYPDVFGRPRPVAIPPGPTTKTSDQQVELAGLQYQGLAANLFGIVAGGVTGINKSLANIMEILLTEKKADGSDLVTRETLDRAISAAKRQVPQYDVLWGYAAEALRFKPQGSAIARMVVKDVTLQGVAIPRGTFVLASHPSAMFDERVFDDPYTFKNRIDAARPVESDKYLHFGGRNLPQRNFGPNTEHYVCLGKELAIIEITEAVRALLVLKNLRRAQGDAGKLSDGPSFPNSLTLEHDGR